MWRRFGEAAYAAVMVVVFTIQTGALVLVAAVFLAGSRGRATNALRFVLASAVAATALVVMLLTAYTLGYQWLSTRREDRRTAELNRWTERWAAVVVGGSPPPQPQKVRRAALEALVAVKEQLKEPERSAAQDLLQKFGVTAYLLEVAGSRRHSTRRRYDSLDLLFRAGSPVGFATYADLSQDPERLIRELTARAWARSLASLRDPVVLDSQARLFAAAMSAADLPQGAIHEALLETAEAAPLVLALLLEDATGDVLAAALDVAGRLRCAQTVDLIPAHLEADDVDVVCSAWRALTGMGASPQAAVLLLPGALESEEEEIRSQAVRFAALLPPSDALEHLTPRLGDESWWVRRSAAWALVNSGAKGRRLLDDASGHHPDPFARRIAVEVLLESGQISAGEAMNRAGVS